MKKTIVIVDACSAARQLAPVLRAQGFDCIHVPSSDPIPKVFLRSFKPEDFAVHIPYTADLQKLVQMMQAYQPVAVLAGAECGVELADALSEALGLVTNGSALSSCRRDKYLMGERVRAAGLAFTPQICTDDVEQICTWYRNQAIAVAVLKPVASAGTDHVTICHNEQDIRSAFAGIFQQTNYLEKRNDKVLAQKLMLGTEYVVNTVSLNGHRVVTDVMRYDKIDTVQGARIYDRDTYMEPTGELQDQLVDYILAVMDALGIQNGPAHAEVFMTPEGPMLTEIGARIDGTSDLEVSKFYLGTGQIELTIEAYTQPKRFMQRSKYAGTLIKHISFVSFIVDQPTVVTGLEGVEKIRELPSFFALAVRYKTGDHLPSTQDLPTSPGHAILAHPDLAVVEADYRTIRAWEKSGMLFR